MSTRYKDSRELPISALFPKVPGKCSYCGKDLTGRQQSWCSKDCSNQAFHQAMFARGHSDYIRSAVFARDNGICAQCGVDGEKLQRISDAARDSLFYYHSEDAAKHIPPEKHFYAWDDETQKFRNLFDEFRSEYMKAARKLWAHTPLNFGHSCWQADHILEVVNGGAHEMENLQTLCNACHKAKTKQLLKKKDELKYPNLF